MPFGLVVIAVAAWRMATGLGAMAPGPVTTFAGNGTAGYLEGRVVQAIFKTPRGLAMDSFGSVYVADSDNNCIRKIANGVTSLVAGSGSAGFADGQGASASFRYPTQVVVDANGDLIVTDWQNNAIRKVTATGRVTTLAGNGTAGYLDGNGTGALFNFPYGACLDGNGNLYVTDQNNHRIRKVTPSGVVSTFAGSGSAAFADGQGTAASFLSPLGITIDANGNLYVADTSNHRIRTVSPSGYVSTLAGTGVASYIDAPVGTQAAFNNPTSLTMDSAGHLFVTDRLNYRIRVLSIATGAVSTWAGSGAAGFLDGGPASAQFDSPAGIVVNGTTNILVADKA